MARRKNTPATRAAFLMSHPGLAADLQVQHRIIADIASRFESYGTMSDKQVALVRKLAKEVRERPVEKTVPAPVGDRQTFTGTIVSAKLHEGAFGTSHKMTVKVPTADGVWLAWGTLPSVILDDARQLVTAGGGEFSLQRLRGASVVITATLKPGNETHFALMSRPSGTLLLLAPEGKEETHPAPVPVLPAVEETQYFIVEDERPYHEPEVVAPVTQVIDF